MTGTTIIERTAGIRQLIVATRALTCAVDVPCLVAINEMPVVLATDPTSGDPVTTIRHDTLRSQSTYVDHAPVEELACGIAIDELLAVRWCRRGEGCMDDLAIANLTKPPSNHTEHAMGSIAYTAVERVRLIQTTALTRSQVQQLHHAAVDVSFGCTKG